MSRPGSVASAKPVETNGSAFVAATFEYAVTVPESITLTDNRISDLRPFSELITLTYLQLGGNRITDLSPLSGLVALRSLYLDGNPIEDFTPLYSLRSLTTLSLRDVEMTRKQLLQRTM